MRTGVAAVVFGLASLFGVALADIPFATATFAQLDPKTSKGIPIASAKLGDKHICIVIRDVSTQDGDHSLSLVIYDGAGRETYRSASTVTAKDRKWARTICYGFNPERDAPGTWWYVAELDEQPLVSKELVVGPAKPPVSANTSLERTRDK